MGNSQETEAQAAAWLARRESAPWTRQDAEALEAWLAESTAHKVAFVRLEFAWKEGARLKALGAGLPQGFIPSPADLYLARGPFLRGHGRSLLGSPISQSAASASSARARASLYSRLPRRTLYGALAAVLSCAVIAAGVFLGASGQDYRTPVGTTQVVSLKDGSAVTLNTDTDLRVWVTNRERRIDLKRGEAFFEVAKDPGRPFVVSAGGQRVVAVGTKFSVRREERGLQVRVTEGKVRLEHEDTRAAEPMTLISAGNVARSAPAGVMVAPETPAAIDDALSWRRGYLVFHETPLEEAVAEFNRYSTRKIVITDPTVAQIRIGGNFRSTNVEAFVRLLADGFPVRADVHEYEITLAHR